MPRSGSKRPILVGLIAYFVSTALPAQIQPAVNSSPSASSSLLSGQVINAVTGSPVFRALVQSDNGSQLTDHEGRYSLSASASSVLRIYKPGYYSTPEGEQMLSVIVPSASQSGPLVARLYPESLITGTVISQDGTPLQDVMVSATRSSFSDSGSQWIPMPPRQTNSHGEFRLAVPSGDYRLEVGSGRRILLGSQVIIPQQYPSAISSDGSNTLHIASGAEEQIQLRVETSPTYQIPIRIEPSSDDSFASISAITDTGARIPASATQGPSGSPMTIDLPRGTYTLTATRDRGNQTEYGESRIEVSGPSSSPSILRLSTVSSIPVVINIDRSTSTSDKAPTLQQLGLTLNTTSSAIGPGRAGIVRGAVPSRDGSSSLRATPGSYHLLSHARGSWHIQSAMYGATDLLQHDITIAAGSASTPIIVTVSDQAGSLSGTVTLNGTGQSVWVYLVPSYPSAIPFYSVHSSPTGDYSFANLTPGSYQAIAFELHRQVDLRSPAVMAPYFSYARSVTVAAGNKATVDLKSVPATEVQP